MGETRILFFMLLRYYLAWSHPSRQRPIVLRTDNSFFTLPTANVLLHCIHTPKYEKKKSCTSENPIFSIFRIPPPKKLWEGGLEMKTLQKQNVRIQTTSLSRYLTVFRPYLPVLYY